MESAKPTRRNLRADLAGTFFGSEEFNREAYYRERLERIRRGEKVWLVRTFESDIGFVYDYYVDQRRVGHIDEEYGMCDAYAGRELVAQRTTLLEAVTTLERQFRD